MLLILCKYVRKEMSMLRSFRSAKSNGEWRIICIFPRLSRWILGLLLLPLTPFLSSRASAPPTRWHVATPPPLSPSLSLSFHFSKQAGEEAENWNVKWNDYLQRIDKETHRNSICSRHSSLSLLFSSKLLCRPFYIFILFPLSPENFSLSLIYKVLERSNTKM